jgi:predicted XRE-type DNA-binding protein
MVRRRNEPVRASRGVRNVLADLGVENAAELTTKVRLAVAINRQIAVRGLSQADAAALIGINKPKLSAVDNFKVDGFFAEKLLTMLKIVLASSQVLFADAQRR